MDIVVPVIIFIVGAMMGSFTACQVWRLENGDKSKRSHCMKCGYKLKWYDNVPILSWLFLRGKCRKCGKKIGAMEILSELGMGLVFLLSYFLWPNREMITGLFEYHPMADAPLIKNASLLGVAPELGYLELAKFIVFLALLVALGVCFIYDLRYSELPMKAMSIGIVLAALFASLSIAAELRLDAVMAPEAALSGFVMDKILGYGGAALVLPVLYFCMYKISHERWVGGGDWILNIALALILGDFWLGICTMFLANMLGLVFSLPMLMGKKDKKSKVKKLDMQIPFGPFLISACWIVFMLQNQVLGFFVF